MNTRTLIQRFMIHISEKTGAEGNLRAEEPGDTQSMYKELTKVLQEVVTKKDCNVEELMKTANENYQKVLDKLNK